MLMVVAANASAAADRPNMLVAITVPYAVVDVSVTRWSYKCCYAHLCLWCSVFCRQQHVCGKAKASLILCRQGHSHNRTTQNNKTRSKALYCGACKEWLAFHITTLHLQITCACKVHQNYVQKRKTEGKGEDNVSSTI